MRIEHIYRVIPEGLSLIIHEIEDLEEKGLTFAEIEKCQMIHLRKDQMVSTTYTLLQHLSRTNPIIAYVHRKELPNIDWSGWFDTILMQDEYTGNPRDINQVEFMVTKSRYEQKPDRVILLTLCDN